MTDSGPEHNPFAPPDPSAPPPPPPAAPPPYGAPPPYAQPGPSPGWAHPQLQQPWQQSPWTPPPSRTTSAPAVIALVTAVLALVPVALVLSIAALVRMRHREQRGTGLVYAALSVSAGWAFLISLVIVIGVAGGFDPHSRGSVSALPVAEVGTCLDGGLNATDCSTEHDLEVFFSPTLPDPVWPGTGDVANAADSLCNEAFAGYVGTSVDSSDLGYDFYAPTESDWRAGKHQIACVITPSGDSLRGSVKGSGR